MTERRWTGTSVLYLCPLKALLNNLVGRVDSYAQWLGRRAALWHGDTKESRRQRIRAEAPDILLTTPESLEAMLIGVKTDHARLLGSVRAVVVDEVHSFAGDDRGWHLLAVLERLERVTGRPIQRVGLSATVGNPAELLHWLQGAGVGSRNGQVVAPGVHPPATDGSQHGDKASPEPSSRPAGEVELDYVGENLVLPDVDRRAVRGLKFSAALPERLAVATVAARLADFGSARSVLAESARFQYDG